ncbi:RiPP maturation radical SAM C-methyltransferase [Streptomyces beihaiensis]|uniref:RiPP maturation radical SAM C-methyltransferase n=1 Tax=Streptomyces beihaiensis TaxID=2984495 RepID=A0ABT3TRI3_9ACTN|nr:RiPP maturation radical SAM C-methyltransferase [Streptomyces beihaiensis]MCX3059658.1 RiPP maturation radical SAM C-methyltransferase [Streptomyces beihaiensis]
MRVQLVTMPWQPLDLPSLQVGLLHRLLDRVRPGDEVREFHGSLRWAEFLLDRSGGRLRPRDYEAVGSGAVFHGLGDWVFSGVLYGDEEWGTGRMRRYAARRGLDAALVDTAVAMRRHAAAFIDACARELLGDDPEPVDGPLVVGFTSTFQQNVASLALAAELKRRRPRLTVVFGGSNCEGPMGHALHRNHPHVDHVVRGEGEHALPALLAHLDAGTPPADVPGLCWWDHGGDGGDGRDGGNGGVSRANAGTRRVVPPADIPAPDYDQWQTAIEASPVLEYVQPKLVVEGARGCWWGEKHHCTFCGLNGAALSFRAKPGERLWQEIEHLVRRHRILDIVTVDNILDMAYFKDFLPLAAESGWDLRMHYEVKSNLDRGQIELLSRAGAVLLQPGIESLSSRVLELMDKGVSGARNVRTLRELDNRAITCAWNLLYGFPGETAEDYARVLAQLPALVHLQPPGGAHRIQLERFSPYYTDPSLGFPKRRPADMYQHVYELPESELADLVYLFDTEDAGIGGAIEERLLGAVAAWHTRHHTSTLVMEETGQHGESLLVRDRRQGWPHRTYWFDGWHAAALRLLEDGRTAAALRRRLAADGHEVTDGELDDWLAQARGLGLLFTDGHAHVSLPTRHVPIRVEVLPQEAAR